MKRITLKSEYFEENKHDEYIDLIDEVICDEIRYSIDYDLYRGENINIIDNGGLIVDIEKIYDYDERDVALSYDFNIEYGTLLSLCTGLDYVCYNSEIDLWNTIVLDNDNKINDNRCNEYSESIFFLFDDIETSIWRDCEIPTDDEIYNFIDNYKYKNLINTDELYNYISLSVNELDKIVDKALNNWFENDLQEIYEVNYPTVWCNVKTFVSDNDGEYEYII